MPRGGPPLDTDDSIARLDPETRHFVATTAARRSELELRGAAAFTAVTQALTDLRADLRIVDLSARAIAEEIDHSRIYLSVARAYAGEELPTPPPEPIAVPAYPRVGADGERVLQVVGMCSINETMACGFLELCLQGATAPGVREGLRRVLEDEIRHARIGWAYLGSPDVGDAERRLVSEWLQPMLRAQWRGWCDQIATLPAGECVEHGCPSGKAIERAANASVRDLVLPGFARAGIDVTGTLEWFERGGR
ncbi:MAG: hypothetical protein ACLP1X_23210 [Polyangiaceae bacterium]